MRLKRKTAWLIVLLFLLQIYPAGGQDRNVNAIKPFTISVPDDVLRDLRERLTRVRLPEQLEGTGWDYGVELDYFKNLVAYWRDKYDWRIHEKELNGFNQFITEIDGLPIHFIHVKSKEKNAMPLVLVHGWPGSVYEFHKIIGLLTDPVAHGGKAEDAFNVVCPSLPGFGFSGKPRDPGWSVSRMSEVVAKLMERLGYTRYGAQGGDWGSAVANWLGTWDTEHVIGVHLNMAAAGQPKKADPFEGVTSEEKERMEQRNKEIENQRAYMAIQGTRPQTIGYALNDSPVGLAAWIIDKFWAWSDHRGNLENSFTKDELLTNIMIYWVTQTSTSSARIYYERQAYTGGRKAGKAPVGVALFPKEISVPPRKWVEAQYNLVHWTVMPRGGHFAAFEPPELLAGDIRDFFRAYR